MKLFLLFLIFFFLSFRFSFFNKPPLDWQPIAITPQLFAFSIFSSHNLTISERETTVSSTYNHRYVLPKLQFSVWIFNWRKETWWVARGGKGNASENCSKWEQFVAGLTLRDLQCLLTDGSNGFFTFVIIIYIYIDCLLILWNKIRILFALIISYYFLSMIYYYSLCSKYFSIEHIKIF